MRLHVLHSLMLLCSLVNYSPPPGGGGGYASGFMFHPSHGDKAFESLVWPCSCSEEAVVMLQPFEYLHELSAPYRRTNSRGTYSCGSWEQRL